MKMTMSAKIEKLDGRYHIFAAWDEEIEVEADKLVEARQKFSDRLKELGIKEDVVTYKMSI